MNAALCFNKAALAAKENRTQLRIIILHDFFSCPVLYISSIDPLLFCFKSYWSFPSHPEHPSLSAPFHDVSSELPTDCCLSCNSEQSKKNPKRRIHSLHQPYLLLQLPSVWDGMPVSTYKYFCRMVRQGDFTHGFSLRTE